MRALASDRWPDTSECFPRSQDKAQIIVLDFEKLISAEYDVVVRVALVTGFTIGKFQRVESEKCIQCAVLSELVKNNHATVDVQPNGKWMFRCTEDYVDLTSEEDVDEPRDH